MDPKSQIVRFPSCVDTLVWARYQSKSPKLLFFQTLLTPVSGKYCFQNFLHPLYPQVTFVSIEYLPVMSPTEEELSDPRIFSNRVGPARFYHRSDISHISPFFHQKSHVKDLRCFPAYLDSYHRAKYWP